MFHSAATLAVSATDITISQSSDGGRVRVLRIDITADQLAKTCFRQTPPRALDIENAIAVVEDALMLSLREADPKPDFHTELHTDARTFSDFAHSLGAHGTKINALSNEAVERAFNELADIAHGTWRSRCVAARRAIGGEAGAASRDDASP